MGREQQGCVRAGRLRDLLERSLHIRGHHLDKERMVVKHAKLIYFRSVGPHFSLGPRDVLTILPAAGIGAESGRDERQSVPMPVLTHAAQSVRQEWVPVSITPV